MTTEVIIVVIIKYVVNLYLSKNKLLFKLELTPVFPSISSLQMLFDNRSTYLYIRRQRWHIQYFENNIIKLYFSRTLYNISSEISLQLYEFCCRTAFVVNLFVISCRKTRLTCKLVCFSISVSEKYDQKLGDNLASFLLTWVDLTIF